MGSELFDLTGRVAIVTGGSRGLGREMALAFADHGADVVIASRKLDACERVAREVEERGRRALAVAYHAGEWADSDRLYEMVYQHFGRCDVLVNNAGMSPLYPSVDAISEALFDKVVGVNLKGPFRLSALVGTRMAGPDHGGSHGGSIIFVSSVAGSRPGRNELVYGAAKAGVENLAYGLARTLGPDVRVNCIAPGPFLTDISQAWDLEAFEQSARTAFALGRGGEPREIVGAALYLASDASSYTTGAVIAVDGGPR
jgi:NAD(P)-dependent dehydrogenase (short-subunit alcohol dehydrogenase family)